MLQSGKFEDTYESAHRQISPLMSHSILVALKNTSFDDFCVILFIEYMSLFCTAFCQEINSNIYCERAGFFNAFNILHPHNEPITVQRQELRHNNSLRIAKTYIHSYKRCSCIDICQFLVYISKRTFICAVSAGEWISEAVVQNEYFTREIPFSPSATETP